MGLRVISVCLVPTLQVPLVIFLLNKLIHTYLLKGVLAFNLPAPMPPLFLGVGNFKLVSHFHTVQSQVLICGAFLVGDTIR